MRQAIDLQNTNTSATRRELKISPSGWTQGSFARSPEPPPSRNFLAALRQAELDQWLLTGGDYLASISPVTN